VEKYFNSVPSNYKVGLANYTNKLKEVKKAYAAQPKHVVQKTPAAAVETKVQVAVEKGDVKIENQRNNAGQQIKSFAEIAAQDKLLGAPELKATLQALSKTLEMNTFGLGSKDPAKLQKFAEILKGIKNPEQQKAVFESVNKYLSGMRAIGSYSDGRINYQAKFDEVKKVVQAQRSNQKSSVQEMRELLSSTPKVFGRVVPRVKGNGKGTGGIGG